MLLGVTFTGQEGRLDIISSCVIPESTFSEVWECVRARVRVCAKLARGSEKRLETYHLILVPFVE